MAFDDELQFEKELVHILQEQHGWKDGVLYNPDEEELKKTGLIFSIEIIIQLIN